MSSSTLVKAGGTICALALVGIAARLRPAPLPIEAASSRVDLGRVPEKKVASGTVLLRNRTGREVAIAQVKTSCGCTTTNAPKSIAAGATAPLHIRFDSTNMFGAIHKSLWISAKGHEDRPLQVDLEGNVYEELRFDPPQLALGSIPVKSAKSARTTLTRLDGKPLRVTGIQAPARIRMRAERAAPNVVRLVASVEAPGVAGQYWDKIVLRTDDAALPQVTLLASYKAAGLYTISPPEINFGVMNSPQAAQRSVRVRGPRAASLRVLAAPPGVAVTLRPLPTGEYLINALYRAKGGKGQITAGKIVLATDNPRQPRLTIPLYAATS